MLRRDAIWLVAVLAVVAVGLRLAPREHRLRGVQIESGPVLRIHLDARPEGDAVQWRIRTNGADRIVPPISREGRISSAAWDEFARDLDLIGAWSLERDCDETVCDAGWTEVVLSDDNEAHTVVLSYPKTFAGTELQSRLDDATRWPGREIKAIRQQWLETFDRRLQEHNRATEPSTWWDAGRS